MRLLVTGGSGFLGRRTAAYFKELRYQVLTPSHDLLDITDPKGVREWFRQNTPDAVIHTAAISDTGLCQQRPEWSEAVNVSGCIHLAEACRETGAKLVICSSDQVYFCSNHRGPHKETEPLTPGNIYGVQKLRAEQACLEILPETVCLRLSWMFSRSRFPKEHGHFLSAFKEILKDDRRPLTYPIHDCRGITDVDDVVKNLSLALELPGGIWNFGSANDQNTYETVKSVLETLGMEEALRRLVPNEAAFAAAPRDITMDQAKLNSADIRFPSTKEALLSALASPETLPD